MARADPVTEERQSLYERDYCQWVEQQVRLLREGWLHELDITNLVDEIEDLGINRKHAVTSNLVVVLNHLLKHQFQPRRRSRSCLASIAEHRRRLRKEFQHAPSLRDYAREEFEECYEDARRQALIETGRHRMSCRIPRLTLSSRASILSSCPTDLAHARRKLAKFALPGNLCGEMATRRTLVLSRRSASAGSAAGGVGWSAAARQLRLAAGRGAWRRASARGRAVGQVGLRHRVRGDPRLLLLGAGPGSRG